VNSTDELRNTDDAAPDIAVSDSATGEGGLPDGGPVDGGLPDGGPVDGGPPCVTTGSFSLMVVESTHPPQLAVVLTPEAECDVSLDIRGPNMFMQNLVVLRGKTMSAPFVYRTARIPPSTTRSATWCLKTSMFPA
jgi:hypothetical protein